MEKQNIKTTKVERNLLLFPFLLAFLKVCISLFYFLFHVLLPNSRIQCNDTHSGKKGRSVREGGLVNDNGFSNIPVAVILLRYCAKVLKHYAFLHALLPSGLSFAGFLKIFPSFLWSVTAFSSFLRPLLVLDHGNMLCNVCFSLYSTCLI
ncbi:hypothetical protein ILYODFUR_023486 [Ilyodon furcidens]|uniref:Uncharacterized protein n=1 Tax=Ilyodon furcidens TaxID=33524 RepID=A0ABV0U002_9TELE